MADQTQTVPIPVGATIGEPAPAISNAASTSTASPAASTSAVPIPAGATISDPFAEVGGVSHIGPQKSIGERFKDWAAQPDTAENFLRPVTSRMEDTYTQEGKSEHPILSKVGEVAHNLKQYVQLLESISKTGAILPVTPEAEAVPAVAKVAEEAGPSLASKVGQKVKDVAKEVIQGRDVNQAGTEQAVRQAVEKGATESGTNTSRAAANVEPTPVVSGHETILDDHLNALESQEKVAYNKLDKVAGFDLKAEKAQLANDQYKLSQLGNTPIDQRMRTRLQGSITDSTDRIADAESRIKAANIDPREGDMIHTQRMAGEDVKSALQKNVNPDGSYNVDGLLKDTNNLRFKGKYGDRVEQWLGSKEAADDYINRLLQLQQQGAHAVKARWIAGILGYELLKHALGRTGATAAKVATELPL